MVDSSRSYKKLHKPRAASHDTAAQQPRQQQPQASPSSTSPTASPALSVSSPSLSSTPPTVSNNPASTSTASGAGAPVRPATSTTHTSRPATTQTHQPTHALSPSPQSSSDSSVQGGGSSHLSLNTDSTASVKECMPWSMPTANGTLRSPSSVTGTVPLMWPQISVQTMGSTSTASATTSTASGGLRPSAPQKPSIPMHIPTSPNAATLSATTASAMAALAYPRAGANPLATTVNTATTTTTTAKPSPMVHSASSYVVRPNNLSNQSACYVGGPRTGHLGPPHMAPGLATTIHPALKQLLQHVTIPFQSHYCIHIQTLYSI